MENIDFLQDGRCLHPSSLSDDEKDIVKRTINHYIDVALSENRLNFSSLATYLDDLEVNETARSHIFSDLQSINPIIGKIAFQLFYYSRLARDRGIGTTQTFRSVHAEPAFFGGQ